MRIYLRLALGAAIVASLWNHSLHGACQVEGRAAEERTDHDEGYANAPENENDEASAPYLPQAIPIDRDLIFEPVFVGPVGSTAAGKAERLIYSNTLGTVGVNFPRNQPVSDDIATTAPNGCNLTRYRFKVLGKVYDPSPAQPPTTGPYTVNYALYTNCPQAVGSTEALRNLVKIPGTDGMLSFPDDAPRLIEHIVPAQTPVALPTNVYLGLRFDRNNCGTIVGTPAMVGFSGDVLDIPGFPCNSSLGGFPTYPHASFWAEFFSDGGCEDAHLGYKAARASGSPAQIGAEIQGVDDIKLMVDACEMVGYEVAVRGVGFYTFDLRRTCDGQIIDGTVKTFQVNAGTTPLLQIARFNFDPPIPIPQQLWIGFKVTSNSAGAVVAGIQPTVGSSSSDYYMIGIDGCQPLLPTQGVYGNIHASITCDGLAPMGACCDNHIRDEQDEAVCREVPAINCFACASGFLCPWIEGALCDPDPFPHMCGVAACCKPDDTCESLTKNQCFAIEPLDRPRLWQQGQFCHEGDQLCPFNACLASQDDCLRVHPGTGCSNPFCCGDVCDFDSWCCLVEWDEICLRWADDFCAGVAGNDQCAADFPVRGLDGAFEIAVPGSFFGTNTRATQSPIDPGFCCDNGTKVCLNGSTEGAPCVSDNDCDGGGTCASLGPNPGGQFYGTVWHKFVATHTSARISTCGSEDLDSRFSDSLLQVFAVGDPSSGITACNSLIPIGCNDDAGDACPEEPANAEICVGGLTPGQTYYILLGSKMQQVQGRYRLEISAPCEPEPTVSGDYCFDAVTAFEGVTPFDTTGATFECPAASCSPLAQNDIWYNYTATCTGEATFSTCGPTHPNTNLAVYEDCSICPSVLDTATWLACNQDFSGAGCFPPARVVVPVMQGHCYKVRLSDQEGFSVSGDLTITCLSGDCQPNGIPDDQDITNCVPGDFYCRDCNANGILDGCDIRDNPALDSNLNQQIDECETCPPGPVVLLDPPFGVVDARQPHPFGNTSEWEGIDSVQIATTLGAEPSCWNLCETLVNTSLHPPYPPGLAQNEIGEVDENPPGQYRIHFMRPITPGETTIITYTDDVGQATSFRLVAHPGNVDANSTTHPVDLLKLIDVLNEVTSAPWGIYSTDCDHSGLTTPADILCVIDLLNSGWNGAVRPSNSASCP